VGITLQLPNSEVKILSVPRVLLRERCNGHSVLTAEVVLDKPKEPDAIVRMIGQTLQLTLSDREPPLSFRGTIGRIEVRPDVHVLTAFGPSYLLDLVERTRSFDADTPREIGKFDGLSEAFSNVEGIGKLGARAAHIPQHGETDWQLLLRLARASGAYVVTTKDDKLKVVAPPAGEARLLAKASIVSDSYILELSHAAVEVASWDWQTGSIRTKGTIQRADQSKGIEGIVRSAAGALLPGGERHRLLQASDAPNDEVEAKLGSRRRRGAALRWRGRLCDFEVRPGVVVNLAESDLVDVPILIVGRSIMFDVGQSPQLSIEVEAVSAEAAPDEREGRQAEAIPIRAVGEVINIDDPTGQGLVKVRLSWHPEKTSGTWCRLAHSSAGAKHGTFDPPLPGDWVMVLLWPASFDLPLVLGAAYHGTTGMRERIGDLSSRRAILMTPNGQRIIADEKDGRLRLGVHDDTKLVCQLSFTKDPAEITLETASGGQIVMKAGKIELAASESIKFKGTVSIE
jgi:hypothetical protein